MSDTKPPPRGMDADIRTLHGDRAQTASISSHSRTARSPVILLRHGSRQQIFVLEEDEILVGRDPECELAVQDERVSRQHFTIRSEENGHWTITDVGSTNGTAVEGAAITPGAVTLLHDGATVLVGETFLTFYPPGSAHLRALDHLVYDPVTGLFSKEVLESDLALRERRGQPGLLAGFDIDRFGSIRDVDPIAAMELLRSMADELRGLLHSVPGIRLFLVDEDMLAALLPDLGWRDTAAQVETVRRHLTLKAVHITGLSVSISAALVQTGTSTSSPLVELRHKVTQAKLAGGDRSVTAAVRVTWDRTNRAAWARRVPGYKWVLLLERRPSSEAHQFRASLAAALEELPAWSAACIAWTADSMFWFVAVSCSAQAAKAAIKSVDPYRVVERQVDSNTEKWLNDWLDSEIGRSSRALARRELESLMPVAQVIAANRMFADHDRIRHVSQWFEALARLLGNIMIAGLAWAAHRDADATDGVAARRRFELTNALAGFSSMRGAGSWVALIAAVERLVPPDALPAALSNALRANWTGRARSAVSGRNRIHDPISRVEEERITEEIWTQCTEIGNMLIDPACRFVFVESARAMRGSVSRQRIRSMYLEGPSGSGIVERDVVAETMLCTGVWMETQSAWIPLAPLVEYAMCLECNRSDIFTSKNMPFLLRPFPLGSAVDPHEISRFLSAEEHP